MLFNSFVALTDQPEETMIFSKCVHGFPICAILLLIGMNDPAPTSSLLRLRQELSKLIATHTDKLNNAMAKASAQSMFYEQLLQGLSVSMLQSLPVLTMS